MRRNQEISIEPQSPIDFRLTIPGDVDYVVLSLEVARFLKIRNYDLEKIRFLYYRVRQKFNS